ncbi:MAG: hypothetical protein GY856_10570 [bacterium]|nr:hypothetical protein [bacterium]
MQRFTSMGLLTLAILVAAGAWAEPLRPGCQVSHEEMRAALEKASRINAPLAGGQWVGNVYVLPYELGSSYDRYLGNDANLAPRQWVAQSFLEHNPDTYDFIVVVTNFSFNAGGEVEGLYWEISNDVYGIGIDTFDLSADFGSSRLQGYVDVNNIDVGIRPDGTLDDHFLDVLSHELGHRWLARCSFVDGSGQVSDDLLGIENAHWSYLLDSDASYMYGSRWSENEDGTFTATGVMQHFSDLDLYLMGLLDAFEVAPFSLLINSQIPPDQPPSLGDVISADEITVTIDQVIAAEGPRIPAAGEARNELEVAFVFLTAPGTEATPLELQRLEEVRTRWQRQHFFDSRGRSVINVGRGGSPAVGGIGVDLAPAVSWLIAAQDATGSWQDSSATQVRDTAAALTALAAYGGYTYERDSGLNRLESAWSPATELEARRVEQLALNQRPSATAAVDALLAAAVGEGEWGANHRYAGDPVSTSRIIRALLAAGRPGPAAQAWSWLTSIETPAGGWPWQSGAPAAVYPTLEVMGAGLALGLTTPELSEAMSWLEARRSNGGIGDPHPDVMLTAMLLKIMHSWPVESQRIEETMDYLGRHQQADGSWQGSVLKTSLAVTALAPYLRPDLAVSAEQLAVDPALPFTDEVLTLYAAVYGGGVEVAAGTTYQWDLVDGNTVVAGLAGILPVIPAGALVTISEPWDFGSLALNAGSYQLRLTVDPAAAISELDENNNTATIPLTLREHPAGIDLALYDAEIQADPNVITVPAQSLTVSGLVHNIGLSEAASAVIAVQDADQATTLATTTVTVAALASAPFSIPVTLDQVRTYTLRIVADPDDLLADADRSSNAVERVIPVVSNADAAVGPGGLVVTPPTGIAVGQLLTLELAVENLGTSPIADLQVSFSYTLSASGETYPITVTSIPETIAPGEVFPLEHTWQPPQADPSVTLTAVIDPELLLADADRSNNQTATVVTVGTNPFPNLTVGPSSLSFDPVPTPQGESCEISATVTNSSENAAGAFVAEIWLDEIATGTLLHSEPIAGLAAGQSTIFTTDWVVDEGRDRLVYLVADAAGAVAEYDEEDNQALAVADVETLPDLVLSSGQVVIEPHLPHAGETVHLEVTVVNAGDQPADSVLVELTDAGDALVDSEVIATLAGGAETTLTLDWDTGAFSGETYLTLTADPQDTVVEIRDDNNQVSIGIAVQDTDLYVNERYFSPNDDGIRDTTTVYFDATPAEVEVIDEDDAVVRTLVVSSGAHSLVWDGRNDHGSVVPDGVYRLVAGSFEVWVEVDNNLLPITADIHQQLLEGTLGPVPPNRRLTFEAASPIDGELYGTTGSTLWRFTGQEFLERGSTPNGSIWQASSSGEVFITYEQFDEWEAPDFTLVRYPGATETPLIPEACGVIGPKRDDIPAKEGWDQYDVPSLSPDGSWIVWRLGESGEYCLQNADDLGVAFPLGDPWGARGMAYSGDDAGARWSLDSRTVVIGPTVVQPGDPPLVAEVPGGDWVTEPIWDVSADFARRHLTMAGGDGVVAYDLDDGSVVAQAPLPYLHDEEPEDDCWDWEPWESLTHDGRAILFGWIADSGGDCGGSPEGTFKLYDWRRRLERAVDTTVFAPLWESSRDRYLYNEGDWSDDPSYLTPAANLRAGLRPVVLPGNGGIELLVVATDRNLDQIRLAYASAYAPETFTSIGQPTRIPLLGTSWGTWLPPAAGRYLVRLTVSDLAGNQASDTEMVSWDGEHDIASLWLESSMISPFSSPGVLDELIVRYTVLRPANLPFEIVDGEGTVIREIPVAVVPGEMMTSWDGTNDSGAPVADGEYLLRLGESTWPFTVDSTPPAVGLTIHDNELMPSWDEVDEAAQVCNLELRTSALVNRIDAAVADHHLERWSWQMRAEGASDWLTLEQSTSPLVHPSDTPWQTLAADSLSGKQVRLVAGDLAGNSSVALRLEHREELAFAATAPSCQLAEDPCGVADRPPIDELGDWGGLLNEAPVILRPDWNGLLVQSTVRGDWRSGLRLEYRIPETPGAPAGAWQSGSVTLADAPVKRSPQTVEVDGEGCLRVVHREIQAEVVPIYWDHPGLLMSSYEVRLVTVNPESVEVTSPIILFVPEIRLRIEHHHADADGDWFRIENLGTDTLTHVVVSRNGSGISLPQVLEPGEATVVPVGCIVFWSAVKGGSTRAWVEASGVDPVGIVHTSPPIRLDRPTGFSVPTMGFRSASCREPVTAAQGIYVPEPESSGAILLRDPGPWFRTEGWFAPGGVAALTIGVPAEDPTGLPIAGYELLIDGNAVAGPPELTPGSQGTATLDLGGLSEGIHMLEEQYLFAAEEGLLANCGGGVTLTIDRTPPELSIVNPVAGAVLCPDGGREAIVLEASDNIDCASGSGCQEVLAVDYLLDGKRLSWSAEDGPGIDVGTLVPGEHLLEVTVRDRAGNAACAAVAFTSSGVAAPEDLVADPELFSPLNTGGKQQLVQILFTPTAAAEVLIEVWDASPELVSTITGSVEARVPAAFAWDGRDLGGSVVDDGVYRLMVRLTSECGAVVEETLEVEVDTTLPILQISTPQNGDEIGVILEIAALVNDTHFDSWQASLTDDPGCGTCWVDIAYGNQPTTSTADLLARWSSEENGPGTYVLRVVAEDLAGNQHLEEISMTLVERLLVRSFTIDELVISPNGDGKLDTAEIRIELHQDANLTLTAGDNPLLDQQLVSAAEGLTVVWDGTGAAGPVLADGNHLITLLAEDPGSPDFETEELNVTIDTVAPTVAVSSPVEDGLYGLPLAVHGSSEDLHPGIYTWHLRYPSDAEQLLVEGTGDLTVRETLTLTEIPDSDYTLVLRATDTAENMATLERRFVVDATLPGVSILDPAAGAVVDMANDTLYLRGEISTAHPDSYQWSLAPGDQPAPGDFVVIDSQDLSEAGLVELFWSDAALGEGLHTWRLSALDQLGRSGEARIIVINDTAAPELTLTSPLDGAQVMAPIAIAGTIADPNLVNWSLRVEPASGGTVTTLAESALERDGTLVLWSDLPADGSYTLRLAATDAAGHESQVTATVEVATVPTGPPQGLTAQVVNQRDVLLAWQPGPGPAPAGYHLYRHGTRLNGAPIAEPTFTDPSLADGIYSYQVTAVAGGGQESEPSAAVAVTVNTSAPFVDLTSPAGGARVRGQVRVWGTAEAEGDFAEYRLLVQPDGATDPTLILRNAAPISGALLGIWDTFAGSWTDGLYHLRLEAEDLAGNTAAVEITVTLDNTPPDAPVLTAAAVEAQDVDGVANDVRIEWTLDPVPADHAGYYLYRDGLLANAGGPVIGSQVAYLLTGSAYDDKDMPDGTYVYYVTAADIADNESPPSASSGAIVVDTRRPQAVITSPADGSQFEGSVMIAAECPDLDVVSVQFEYEAVGTGIWLPLGAPLGRRPFEVLFEPAASGWYQVRAVAADATGADPAPGAITIEEADLPPPAPTDLVALVDGDTVRITWQAPADPAGDLAGYELYRGGVLVNATLIPPQTLVYTDTGVADGMHWYRVRAVDQAAQPGPYSDDDFAWVFMPRVSWTSPVRTGASVWLEVETDNYTAAFEVTRRQTDGTFAPIDNDFEDIFGYRTYELSFELLAGLNVVRITSMDDDGNRSRVKEMALVSQPPPAAPDALSAAVDGSDVTLDWTATPDPETIGFQVHRGGTLIGVSETPFSYDGASHQLEATSGAAGDWQSVVDGDPVSGWSSDRIPTEGEPDWWQWTWPVATEIAEITVEWDSGSLPASYELDVRAGGEWLWWESMGEWDVGEESVFGVGAEIDGIRVRLREAPPCGNLSCSPLLVEVSAIASERQAMPPYVDSGLAYGVTNYQVRRINLWGQISEPALVTAAVGVSEPPPPTAVTVTAADCDGLVIEWQPPLPPPADLAGFIVHRATTAGGPYTMLGGAIDLSYHDHSAAAGSSYFYVVTTATFFDQLLVESPFSDEAGATAACLDPAAPVITTPTVAGQPIERLWPSVYIGGRAQVGATIDLVHDGEVVATTTAEYGWQRTSHELPDYTSYRLSFDAVGRRLAWAVDTWSDDYVMVLDRETGAGITIDEWEQVRYPGMSPDGSQVAIVVEDGTAGLAGAVLLYRIADGTTTPISADAAAAGAPTFSPDGSLLAYFVGSNTLEIYDLQTSQVVHSLLVGSTSTCLAFSPDGATLVYAGGYGLFLIDVVTGAVTQSTGSGTRTIMPTPFSPDGGALIFQERPYGNSSTRLWVRNLATGLETMVSPTDGELSGVFADDAAIVFMEYSSDDLIRRSLIDGSEQLIARSVVSYAPSWVHQISGRLFVALYGRLTVADLGGGFYFWTVLNNGWNSFIARQHLDGSTIDSAAVEINALLGSYPDIAAEALSALPAGPIAGEPVLIEGTIRALSGGGSFTALLALSSPDAAVQEVLRTPLTLAAGESATVRHLWPTDGLDGDTTWYLVADVDDDLFELDETNNVAELRVPVRDHRGAELSLSLNSSAYPPTGHLGIDVGFFSNLDETSYLLEIMVEDASGALVAVVDSRQLTDFAPGAVSYQLDHALDGVYPGAYRVHGLAFSGETVAGGETVAEVLAPFTVLGQHLLVGEVTVDRTLYTEGDPVNVSGRVTNLGSTLVEQLTATIRISTHPGGTPQAVMPLPIPSLEAGGSADLQWTWDTAETPPETYVATLTVTDDSGTPMAVAESFPFVVEAEDLVLAGTLSLAAAQVEPGPPLPATSTVGNNGAADLTGLTIALRIIEPETMTIVHQQTRVVDLPAGAADQASWDLATTDLERQPYVVALSALGELAGEPFELHLASAGLLVQDLTPPQVAVLSPLAGLVCDDVEIRVEATDNAGGVRQVFYQSDQGSLALPIPLANPLDSSDLYATTWLLAPEHDGTHQIMVAATDFADNQSDPITVAFDVDVIPPELTADIPQEGACLAQPVAVTYSAGDARLDEVTATLNGTPYTSGTEISEEGDYQLLIEATDTCEHVTAAAASFTVDRTQPLIAVDGVAPGGTYPSGVVVRWRITDASPLSEVAASLNGVPIDGRTTIDKKGRYLLKIRGTDCAGNQAATMIGFRVLDDDPPGESWSFSDETASAGLGTAGVKSGGLAWCDFNHDGWPDALVNTGSGEDSGRSYLYFNNAGGADGIVTFADVTETHAAGLIRHRGQRSAICADVNNDGWLDLARNDEDRIEIYLNNGPTATPPWSLGDPHQVITEIPGGLSSEGMGWLDFDNDGDLDLVIDNDAYGTDLFANDGRGYLVHVTPDDDGLGLPQSAVSGDYLAVADYNNDGWVDVVARKQGQLDLYTNRDGSFSVNTSFDGGASALNKGGVAFCDLDADGDLDLVWTDSETNQIWRNDDGSLVATGEPDTLLAAGDVDGVACADVDNDGDLDLFLADDSGPGYLFINETPAGGPLSFAGDNHGIDVGGNAESVAFADYDRDGDLDLLVNRDNASNQLWQSHRNDHGDSSYLAVRALRCLTDGWYRDDVGATVRLWDADGVTPRGPLQEVSGGRGHGSQSSPLVHLGLPQGRDATYHVEVAFTGENGEPGPVLTTPVVPSELGPYQLLEVRSCSDGNQAPVAIDQTRRYELDTPLALELQAFDPEAHALSWQLVSMPVHGTLIGTAPFLTYLPDPGFTGDDHFTFQVSDGELVSNQATMTVNGPLKHSPSP